MKPLPVLFILLIIAWTAQAQEKTCAPVIRPQFSENVKKELEEKLASAKSDWEKNKNGAEEIIWYGRRTAYPGKYEESIEIFTDGIKKHPGDARMYRHRAHRYITVRCFDKAVADLKKAAQLIKGKPDETEPDGLPNSKNIPTSTLQSNIWYHLGLSYFFKGENKKALKAWRECLKVSKNPDMYVAGVNWMYITLRKLKKNKEADHLLETIQPGTELLESGDYLKILLLYKQQAVFTDPLTEMVNGTALSSATYGFGLGNYLWQQGEREQAKMIFQKVVSGSQWSSFGYIAAEAALKNLVR